MYALFNFELKASTVYWHNWIRYRHKFYNILALPNRTVRVNIFSVVL